MFHAFVCTFSFVKEFIIDEILRLSDEAGCGLYSDLVEVAMMSIDENEDELNSIIMLLRLSQVLAAIKPIEEIQ